MCSIENRTWWWFVFFVIWNWRDLSLNVSYCKLQNDHRNNKYVIIAMVLNVHKDQWANPNPIRILFVTCEIPFKCSHFRHTQKKTTAKQFRFLFCRTENWFTLKISTNPISHVAFCVVYDCKIVASSRKNIALAHGLRLQFLLFESDLQLISQWINVSNTLQKYMKKKKRLNISVT